MLQYIMNNDTTYAKCILSIYLFFGNYITYTVVLAQFFLQLELPIPH